MLTKFDYAVVQAVENFEERFLTDLIVDDGLEKLGVKGHDLLATEAGNFAIDRVPAVSEAARGMAGSGDAAARIVKVAMALMAESRRSTGFTVGMDEGAQGDHG